MSVVLNLVQPEAPTTDIPGSLRELADAVESGELAGINHLAWVTTLGDGTVAVALIGDSPEPVAVTHLLFGKAMRVLEQEIEE